MKNYSVREMRLHIVLEQFLGNENLEFIEVVSPIKTEKVAVINYIKLRNILREKGIIPYGEDMDEDFQLLLSLSSNREDLIMLRKFKKCLKDIKDFKYFQYFGMYFREEAFVDSDFENEEEKANMTADKLMQENKQYKDLHENHKS